MPFYENMSSARKRIVLSASKDSLESEMLQLVIRLGLSPETFDEQTYVSQEYDGEPAKSSDSARLATICETYKSTVERLNELD
jgi:hypothetical protein